MQTRSNRVASIAVEDGLFIDNEQGAARAWAFMAAAQVPPAVILRVLSNPDRRRPTDPAFIVATRRASARR